MTDTLVSQSAPLVAADFERLDHILDGLRAGSQEIPHWEFCEGFLAALVCCRQAIGPEEYLPVLLDLAAPGKPVQEGQAVFPDAMEGQAFVELFERRRAEVARALDASAQKPGTSLHYLPVVTDLRGVVASLPEAERASIGPNLPAFAQVWALGFLYAVESWPEAWALPRDPDLAEEIDVALTDIVALTEDDVDPPLVGTSPEDTPPHASRARLDAFSQALWAVSDLRTLWLGLGPRVVQVVRGPKLGRNDPCHCGSGRKFKKCHGAPSP